MSNKQKYHVSPVTGKVAVCKAHKRACRYSDDQHFDSQEQAERFAEQQLSEQHGLTGVKTNETTQHSNSKNSVENNVELIKQTFSETINPTKNLPYYIHEDILGYPSKEVFFKQEELNKLPVNAEILVRGGKVDKAFIVTNHNVIPPETQVLNPDGSVHEFQQGESFVIKKLSSHNGNDDTRVKEQEFLAKAVIEHNLDKEKRRVERQLEKMSTQLNKMLEKHGLKAEYSLDPYITGCPKLKITEIESDRESYYDLTTFGATVQKDGFVSPGFPTEKLDVVKDIVENNAFYRGTRRLVDDSRKLEFLEEDFQETKLYGKTTPGFLRENIELKQQDITTRLEEDFFNTIRENNPNLGKVEFYSDNEGNFCAKLLDKQGKTVAKARRKTDLYAEVFTEKNVDTKTFKLLEESVTVNEYADKYKKLQRRYRAII